MVGRLVHPFVLVAFLATFVVSGTTGCTTRQQAVRATRAGAWMLVGSAVFLAGGLMRQANCVEPEDSDSFLGECFVAGVAAQMTSVPLAVAGITTVSVGAHQTAQFNRDRDLEARRLYEQEAVEEVTRATERIHMLSRARLLCQDFDETTCFMVEDCLSTLRTTPCSILDRRLSQDPEVGVTWLELRTESLRIWQEEHSDSDREHRTPGPMSRPIRDPFEELEGSAAAPSELVPH
jgi:hypothetical protein